MQTMFFRGEADLSENFAEWYAASFLRFSTRKYRDMSIGADDKAAVDALAEQINRFADGVRILAVYETAPDLFESFGYTKLAGVPAFLAVLSDRSQHADVKAGFYGEAMCLALTAHGMKTCWVSGSIKKQHVKKYIEIQHGERFLTTIAFGYGEDRVPDAITARRKRKPIEKTFEGELLNETYQRLMECVQNAPSAINRQPWLYRTTDSHLAVKKPVIPGGPFPEALDIGISMLHASCAAGVIGIAGVWQSGSKDLGVFLEG